MNLQKIQKINRQKEEHLFVGNLLRKDDNPGSYVYGKKEEIHVSLLATNLTKTLNGCSVELSVELVHIFYEYKCGDVSYSLNIDVNPSRIYIRSIGEWNIDEVLVEIAENVIHEKTS